MRLAFALLAAALVAAAPVGAQTLRIAMAAETTSADPHHYALAPNSTLRWHLFDALTRVDARGSVQPALATSWERSDDRTWIFTLRDGVKFGNGATFGAPDVVFSYCRILNNKEELVASFSQVVRRLEAVEAIGEDKLRIRTAHPEPLLLSDLAALAILPRSLGPAGVTFDAKTDCGGGGPYPTQAEFSDGKAAIGTGPYQLILYSRAGTTVLKRREGYWGAAPHWAEVRLSPITAPASRLASLLAGDQDLIEAPGTADLPRLRDDSRFAVTSAPTTRLIFIQLDTARDPSPFVPGRNPLKDPRVRQALSLALSREAIDERIMDKLAVSAAQFLPDGMAGTIPSLKTLPYDPARAKTLLAEAGFPQGFTLTVHGPNNRYVNDAQIVQAVAQQWQRIGVKTEVELMPSAMYFGRRGKRDFSAALGGWAPGAAETLEFFRTWLITTEAEAGLGTSNYGGWSDPQFDAAVKAAMAEMDDAKRAALLQEAGRRALEQMPVIPIHFERAAWASKAEIHYPGRVDQTTMAAEVSGP
ncbi:MAG TPA: ABC transporter substrate-binding protein [Acetobacteraceae bacterium]|nr:ABC transporter substrate-binding protein [Acetobacteraceae bacterium]